uniref:N-acetyltransferase domain-containing protein n=1 Tax=Parastrongyloides trichosuri TaxID=131310 RepID=A0A0N5A0A8_PARTI
PLVDGGDLVLTGLPTAAEAGGPHHAGLAVDLDRAQFAGLGAGQSLLDAVRRRGQQNARLGEARLVDRRLPARIGGDEGGRLSGRALPAIEDMRPDLGDLGQARRPPGVDVIGVVVRGRAHALGHMAVQSASRDPLGSVPGPAHRPARQGAVAGEAELAARGPLGALIDDAADAGGIVGIAHPVQHDLGHALLPLGSAGRAGATPHRRGGRQRAARAGARPGRWAWRRSTAGRRRRPRPDPGWACRPGSGSPSRASGHTVRAGPGPGRADARRPAAPHPSAPSRPPDRSGPGRRRWRGPGPRPCGRCRGGASSWPTWPRPSPPGSRPWRRAPQPGRGVQSSSAA